MKDTITRMLLKIVNILFLYNVLGTCYGCLFGLILLSLKAALATYIPIVALVEWYGFISFGILMFNIKPMVKKKYEDPKIEMQLKYLREILKEANLSDKEKRVYWRETINCILNISTENMNKTDKDNDFNYKLFA
ncbi:hypothetical protein [uncultured Clostridium sp.]|uniref:hypothetical protein n=1 Tax=uncultured Clostridium sp. TaxID=59620 RepID=UPI000EA2E549|nr:hypothetical protein [uncultured Clostridium sp.]RKI74797.1 hypothetical protein D7V90_23415 [bacterium 1xD42-87]